MAEPAGIWCIPGDEISITIEEFNHQQHLLEVYALYVHESDASRRLWLVGSPEEISPSRRESHDKVVYTSQVTVTEVIDSDMLFGRYWFRGFQCYTYGGQTLNFEQPPVRLSSWVPERIVVLPEPIDRPKLALPYVDNND